jgi:hypothetical protein
LGPNPLVKPPLHMKVAAVRFATRMKARRLR